MSAMLGYVDPGIGLLVWQAVVATFLGLIFYIRKSRDKLLFWGAKLLRINKSARPLAQETRQPEPTHGDN